MLSIKFVGFLFHGVNNFFHDLQALLFISVGFSFPVCYKGLKFTLKTFNKCDMPNNVMHKQDESPAADSRQVQNAGHRSQVRSQVTGHRAQGTGHRAQKTQ